MNRGGNEAGMAVSNLQGQTLRTTRRAKRYDVPVHYTTLYYTILHYTTLYCSTGKGRPKEKERVLEADGS